ncbi:hypothetical protein Bca101_055993 [Brassica carinata]
MITRRRLVCCWLSSSGGKRKLMIGVLLAEEGVTNVGELTHDKTELKCLPFNLYKIRNSGFDIKKWSLPNRTFISISTRITTEERFHHTLAGIDLHSPGIACSLSELL